MLFLLDIAFVPDDLSHGFLLGTRQTILETKDGGETWASHYIPSAEDEDFNHRFNSISFKGKEGWIIGKPVILLYTSDAGQSWDRIPLSGQLPGDMVRRTDVLSTWSGIQRYVRMKKTYSGKVIPVAMDTAAAKHLSHAYGTAAVRVAAIAQVCSSQYKEAKESLSCTTRIAEFLRFCTRCQQMLP